jgi:hypothetical protein
MANKTQFMGNYHVRSFGKLSTRLNFPPVMLSKYLCFRSKNLPLATRPFGAVWSTSMKTKRLNTRIDVSGFPVRSSLRLLRLEIGGASGVISGDGISH